MMNISDLRKMSAAMVIAGLVSPVSMALAQDSTTTNEPAKTVAVVPPLPSAAVKVLDLAQAKVGDGTIIAYIKNSGKSYHLNAGQIIYLRNHGVSDTVITVMLNQPMPTDHLAPTATSVAQPAAAPISASTPAPVPAATPTPAYTPAATSAPDYIAPTPTVAPAPIAAPAPTVTYVPVAPPAPYYYGPSYYYPNYYYYPTYPYYPSLSLSFGWGGHWGGWHGGWHGGGWHH